MSEQDKCPECGKSYEWHATSQTNSELWSVESGGILVGNVPYEGIAIVGSQLAERACANARIADLSACAVELEAENSRLEAEVERLKNGRKRWYVCPAGIYEGQLDHISLDSNFGWVVAETDCYRTREAAELACQTSGRAAKEKT